MSTPGVQTIGGERGTYAVLVANRLNPTSNHPRVQIHGITSKSEKLADRQFFICGPSMAFVLMLGMPGFLPKKVHVSGGTQLIVAHNVNEIHQNLWRHVGYSFQLSLTLPAVQPCPLDPGRRILTSESSCSRYGCTLQSTVTSEALASSVPPIVEAWNRWNSLGNKSIHDLYQLARAIRIVRDKKEPYESTRPEFASNPSLWELAVYRLSAAAGAGEDFHSAVTQLLKTARIYFEGEKIPWLVRLFASHYCELYGWKPKPESQPRDLVMTAAV